MSEDQKSDDRRSSDGDWRERMIVGITEVKAEVRLGNVKVDNLDLRINGRLKRLEKTVFGDEEMKVIGLAESARAEAREVKELNKKWAVAIAIIVFFAQNMASWVARKAGFVNEPLTAHEIHEAVK
jgi:hypothetical protein